MLESKLFSLPKGYGGNMDYSNVSTGTYRVPTKEGTTLSIEVVSNEPTLDVIVRVKGEEVDVNNLFFILVAIDMSGILPNKGIILK